MEPGIIASLCRPAVEIERRLPAEMEALLYDPQTSGGLLIATTDPEPGAVVIGRVTELRNKPIHVL